MPARRPVDVLIRDESIRPGQFLKLADLAKIGSGAKDLISAGEVLVNGQPEARRGGQVRAGDVVESGGRLARVARRPGPAAVLARPGAVITRGDRVTGQFPPIEASKRRARPLAVAVVDGLPTGEWIASLNGC